MGQMRHHGRLSMLRGGVVWRREVGAGWCGAVGWEVGVKCLCVCLFVCCCIGALVGCGGVGWGPGNVVRQGGGGGGSASALEWCGWEGGGVVWW